MLNSMNVVNHSASVKFLKKRNLTEYMELVHGSRVDINMVFLYTEL